MLGVTRREQRAAKMQPRKALRQPEAEATPPGQQKAKQLPPWREAQKQARREAQKQKRLAAKQEKQESERQARLEAKATEREQRKSKQVERRSRQAAQQARRQAAVAPDVAPSSPTTEEAAPPGR